jgi:putative spermidine/putrescine transport system substrate-binding protein
MLMWKVPAALAGMLALSWTAMAQPTLPKGDADAAAFRDGFLAGTLGWPDVVARARKEGAVNWFYWGGNEALNGWVSSFVIPEMAKLGVTLKASRIPNTRDAVDLVVADNSAGRGIGQGTVDAIWINGANTLTLGNQGALLGAFAQRLPNAKYFDFDPNSTTARLNLYDLGYPTAGRLMPWGAEQYICYIDSGRLPPAKAPSSFKDLEPYLRANPGRFTYIKPPHFNGNTFVETVLYATNPEGYKPFQKERKDFTADEFAKLVAPGFEYLRRIEPFLLGGGGRDGQRGAPIYPENPAASWRMFADGEIDMGCGFGLFSVSVRVANGTFPPSAQTLAFPKEGMILGKNFIGIPNNAPHPAAALVLANFLSSPEAQITKLAAVGYPLGLELARLDPADQAKAVAAAPKLKGATLAELGALAIPDFNASLVHVIERLWADYIERRSSRSISELVSAVFAKP